MTNDADPAAASEIAALVAEQIERIRRAVRASILSGAADYPVTLTAPQIHAMEILVEESRRLDRGVSLSDLSRRMGLAHSTVSGIVDRLARDGVVQRVTDPTDRRVSLIGLTDDARIWLGRDLAAARIRPFLAALLHASEAERASVLEGLAILERLLATAKD